MEKSRWLQMLLESAVRQICVAELGCKSKVRAQCLLGLTFDDTEVVLIQVDEVLLEKQVVVECDESENLRECGVSDTVLHPYSCQLNGNAPLHPCRTLMIEPEGNEQITSFESCHFVEDSCHEIDTCLGGRLDVPSSNNDNVLGTILIESYGNYESVNSEVKAELIDQWPCELRHYQETVSDDSDVQHSMMPFGSHQNIGNNQSVSETGHDQSKVTSVHQMISIPTQKRSSACYKDGKMLKYEQCLAKHPKGLSKKGKLCKHNALSSSIAEIKRKRGRPKKSSLLKDVASFVEKVKAEPHTNSKQSCIKSGVAILRKRGRPKKFSLLKDVASSVEEVKAEPHINSKQSCIESGTAIMQKRGRPKKSSLLKDVASSVEKVEAEPNINSKQSCVKAGAAILWKRGRLKQFSLLKDVASSVEKVKAEPHINSKQSHITSGVTILRKRGRPKKSSLLKDVVPSVEKFQVEPHIYSKQSLIQSGVAILPRKIKPNLIRKKSVILPEAVRFATKDNVVQTRGHQKTCVTVEDAAQMLLKRRRGWTNNNPIINSFEPSFIATSTLVKKPNLEIAKLPNAVVPLSISDEVAMAPLSTVTISQRQLKQTEVLPSMIKPEFATQAIKQKQGRPKKTLIVKDTKPSLSERMRQRKRLIVRSSGQSLSAASGVFKELKFEGSKRAIKRVSSLIDVGVGVVPAELVKYPQEQLKDSLIQDNDTVSPTTKIKRKLGRPRTNLAAIKQESKNSELSLIKPIQRWQKTSSIVEDSGPIQTSFVRKRGRPKKMLFAGSPLRQIPFSIL